MPLTFKTFIEYLDLPEDASQEQIMELFGKFRNNKKIDDLKAQREKLQAKLKDPNRESAWQKAKRKAAGLDDEETEISELTPAEERAELLKRQREERLALTQTAGKVSGPKAGALSRSRDMIDWNKVGKR